MAAEIAHRFSKNENTFTVGGLYELDTLTTVKARLNNHGKLAALLQHEWRPKSLVTLSGEVDTKSLDKTAKIGLALALKPWEDELKSLTLDYSYWVVLTTRTVCCVVIFDLEDVRLSLRLTFCFAEMVRSHQEENKSFCITAQF